MKKTKKILIRIAVGLEIMVLLVPSLVSAFDYPSPSEIASDMEDRYHISKESVQNSAEGFNVGANKTGAPQVTVTFDPTDPKPGELVTATAHPMYFGNSSDTKNYYTWYLKRDKCSPAKDLTDTLGKNAKDEVKELADKYNISKAELLQQCDDDYDGDITLNDWIVKAHRIIAGNGYNWRRSLGNGNTGYDSAINNPSPICNNPLNRPEYCDFTNQYLPFAGNGADSDNDGYFAPWGGADQTNALTDSAQKVADVIAKLQEIGTLLKACTPTPTDNNNDGLPDSFKIDTDGDGVPDTDWEPGDGLPSSCQFGTGAIMTQISAALTQIGDLLGLDAGTLIDIVGDAIADTDWRSLIGCITWIPPDFSNCVSKLDYLFQNLLDKVWKGIIEAVSEKLKLYYASLPKCYVHDFTTGVNHEMQWQVNDNLALPICPHLFPKTHFTPGMIDFMEIDFEDMCKNFSDREDHSECLSVPGDCLNGSGVFDSNRANCCYDSNEKLQTNDDQCKFNHWLTGNNPIIGTGSNITQFLDNINLFQGLNPRFNNFMELFWHTNPKDPSTADNGNKDAMNVYGVGVNSFSWYYNEGDKLGVVVEGVGLEPTKYDDGSMKVMWAYPNNNCGIPYSKKNTKKVYVKGYEVEIPTVEVCPIDLGIDETDYPILGTLADAMCFGIRQCLYNNLLDPTQGGQSAKIGVNLSYTPENPVNDAMGQIDATDERGNPVKDSAGNPVKENSIQGDTLTLTANTINVKDGAFVKYDWELWTSDKSSINPEDDTGWYPLSINTINGVSATNSAGVLPENQKVKRLSGVGLSTLKIPLAIKNQANIKFMKVRVDVTENISEGITDEGTATVMFPVSSMNNQLKVYPVQTVDWTTDPTHPVMQPSTNAICASGRSLGSCPVIKNDIIKVQIDNSDKMRNIGWTLDGEAIQPIDSNCSAFKDCSTAKKGEGTDLVYFPILKEVGDTYTLNFVADKIETDGEINKVNISKNFVVADPEITVSVPAGNTENRVLLGSYVDMLNSANPDEPNMIPDYSETEFQVNPDQSITLEANSNVPLPEGGNYIWNVDGISLSTPGSSVSTEDFTATTSSDSQSKQLTLTATQYDGYAYTVSVGPMVCTQSNSVKKFLNQYYDVQWGEFYEKNLTSSVDVKVTIVPLGASADKSTPKKFLAAIFTTLPSYLSFLFRIIMTTALILFVSWLILAFTPSSKNNEN